MPSVKPPLESRLLHLHTSSGAKSGYVILLNPSGVQAGDIFDLRDPESVKQLQLAYENAYRTPEEQREYLETLATKEEEEKFKSARKIKLSEYEGPGGVFWNDSYYDSKEDLFHDIFALSGTVKTPTFVWGSRKVKIEQYRAADLWEEICTQLGDWPEVVPGSDALLDKALEEFYSTNRDRLIAYEVDYTNAILLD